MTRFRDTIGSDALALTLVAFGLMAGAMRASGETDFVENGDFDLFVSSNGNGTDTDYGIDNIRVVRIREPARDVAWQENTGWIDFGTSALPTEAPRVVFGRSYLAGYAWNTNTGWIHLGDGSPANGYRYANLDGGDFGVNHDGRGNLSGLAWSENAGWINFGWASAEVATPFPYADDTEEGDAAPSLPGPHPERPRVDLVSGEFDGYAWSASHGWINLGTSRLAAERMVRPDVDGDGIGDAFEYRNFGDLVTADAESDSDHDGSSDLAESIAATDPGDPSSYLRIVNASYAFDLSEAELEFTSNPAALYRVETSTDLHGGSWSTVAPPGLFAPDEGFRTVRSLNVPPGDRRFFRVVAVPPLRDP